MDLFTEVYVASVDLLKAKCFDERWSNIEPKLKALLATDGPEESQAMALDLIRSTLAKAANGNGNGKERVTAAEEILKVSRSSSTGFQDRAALLKAMKHFYFVIRKGNQRIWVVDLPQRNGQWTYDLFSGKSIEELRPCYNRKSRCSAKAEENSCRTPCSLRESGASMSPRS